MDEEKKKSVDGMLRDAAIEKFGLKGVMDEIEKVKPLLEKVSASADLVKGDDGKTPVLGVDYLNEEEQKRVLDMVTPKKGVHYNDGAPGNDGYSPVKGLDFFTEDEVAQFKKDATPVKGTDYFTPAEISSFKSDITPIKGKDYNDGENPTPQQFIDVLKNLKGKDAAAFSQVVGSKIDISHIRNAGSFVFNGKNYKTEELMHGGGSGGSSGTVTQVDTSGGITGGPITTTGTVQLATNIRPIATLGTANQLIRVNGAGTALEYFTSSSGGVSSVVGTANRITVDSTDPANPIVNISAAYVGQTSITTLGTIATGVWAGTTIAVAHGGTGVTTIAAKSIWLANSVDTITSVTPGASQSIRINAGNTAWEAYTPAAGTVTSVSGTANRITSTGGATPVIDIDAAYVGQASITTLGTVSTGTWAGTTIAVNHGGTGGTSAGIALFNNITGFTAAGATGTTSTNLVFSTSPTLVTPTLGIASATTINKVTITAPATGSTLTIADGKTLTVSNTLTFTGTDSSSVNFGAGGTVLYTASTVPLTVGSTTIASGTSTRILYDNAGVLGEYTITGTGTVVAMQTSPSFTTPSLGVATATSVNGLTITTTTGVLTMTNAKTLSVTNTLTLSGTDSTVMTFPTTTATIARTDAAQTFTGTQTVSLLNTTPQALTVSSNAATADINHGIQNFTNSSAAGMTITLTTTSAVDGQFKEIRIYDFSAVTQSITWVNTENSTVTAPATSNGSTTLPLSTLFQFNSQTSKWRCLASA